MLPSYCIAPVSTEERLQLNPSPKYWELQTRVVYDEDGECHLTLEEENDPVIVYHLIVLGLKEIITSEGFRLNLMEFIADHPEEYLLDILRKGFEIPDYAGSVPTVIDFCHCVGSGRKKVRHHPLKNTHQLSYRTLLQGERQYYEAHHLACRLNPQVEPYTWMPFPITTDLPPIDVVRLVQYCHGTSYHYASVYKSLEDKERWCQEGAEIPKIKPYVLGYERLQETKRREIGEILGLHLPMVLTELVLEYGFFSLLERASRIGMIFPPRVDTEAKRYRYFFDNLRDYNRVLSQQPYLPLCIPRLNPDGTIVFSTKIDESPSPYALCTFRTDRELLDQASERGISISQWNSRENLIHQALAGVEDKI